MISKILELNLKYPQFNDPEFTTQYPKIESEIKHEYDVYAMMIWNCIGLISLEYKGHTDRCPFIGAIQYWSTLHSKWIEEENHGRHYMGIWLDLPGLEGRYVSFNANKFPDVYRKKIIRRIRNIFYYQLFLPILFPISAKYRKELKNYMSRAR